MLERAAQSRSRLKLAVFTSIGISVVGLTAMLIGGQGCKRDEPVPPPAAQVEIPPPAYDPGTSAPPPVSVTPASTNGATAPTRPIPDYVAPPPVPGPVLPPEPVKPEPTLGARDYVIQKGDTFASLAKKEGLSTKAIEKANPGVDPRKLKINQKIVIPPPTAPTAAPAPMAAPTNTDGGESYAVQSGDNLTKIAKKHGVSVPALRKANHLTTDRIKVNQKLVIPPKAPGAAPVPAPAGGLPPA